MLQWKEAAAPPEIVKELDKLSAKYDIKLHSNQGSNGYVFSAKNRILESEVIIKFYYWGGSKKLHAEPQALMSLDSANILQIFDAGISGDEWAYFVTPRCDGGDLDGILGSQKISNLVALDKCAHILTGLACLHGRRLVHRDLKPANIYVHSGKAIIGDFGSIAKLPEGLNAVPASKHAVVYRPPESIKSDEYGFSGDIYQCGVVLYQLLGGNLPYEEIYWLNKSQKLKHEKLSYPDSTLFADDCLRERIAKGRLLDFTTVNAWAPASLIKIARKACSIEPKSRFESAAEFLARLSEQRSFIHNWQWDDDGLVLAGATSLLRERRRRKVSCSQAQEFFRVAR